MHNETIELRFGVVGQRVPLEHEYLLYSALSKAIDERHHGWMHSADVAVLPISGRYTGNGWLSLNSRSSFALRMSAHDVPIVLGVAGKSLRIGGDTLRVGVASVHPLRPAATLHARIVTTRNGEDEERFDAEVARQLSTLSIKGSVQRGRRRYVVVKDKKIVGHELLVANLTAEESLKLQEHGIGGRRKMGCGVFAPLGERQ